MQKATFTISGMHCPSCALVLEGLEDELPGVGSVTVSFPKQRMTVEFDESKIQPTDIITAVQKENYQASLI